ncbi:hypothetical protein [Amygdalobacter nucleatus]|uniref:hypothetical protein n=1 Tax=Amygdalobacter nucleatus TaxID=3029274 RepID=UPI0027A5C31D|nr:hypothetical protein [Amygdalobacter nucleatus]WEG37346.1 hypothetical protein PYS63_02590 [Amygdalobacter nucleatus]
MPRRKKKSSLSAELASLCTILMHTAFGLLIMLMLVATVLFCLLVLLTGNSYHVVYLLLGIVLFMLIIVAWLRYYMQGR